MGKQKVSELPKGFISIDKFNGSFKANGTQFEFSKLVRLNSEAKGVVDGHVYRYAIAPHKLYFTSETGENLQDVNGYSFAKETEEE